MLKGPDVSIEISLKEHGLAWKTGEAETRFYYGVDSDGSEYIKFDWADLENNLNFDLEYDWADLLEVANFAGMTLKDWEKAPQAQKIQDMIGYYGTENVFGSTYTEGMTYEEVIKGE
jgi:hypothetical protein